MRRNWRAIAAVLGVLGLAAVLLPSGAGAQKVKNPGAFSLQSTGGQIRIGSILDLDLTPQPVPQCSDGVDNDLDTKVDALDAQCAAGPQGQPKEDDDNEMVPGFQPKIDVSITGSIDANGNVTVPTTGIIFPPAYIKITNPLNGLSDFPKVEILATAPATGVLNPITGDMVLNVKFRAKMSGYVNGNLLNSTCSIGTAAAPISLALTTGFVPAVGTNPSLTGFKYSTVGGTAILVNNSFAVPGASGCNQGIVDLNGAINQNVGLPSIAGKNAAVLAGKTLPILDRAISPVIASTPGTLNGPAPFTVNFNAGNSVVSKGPATYAWTFGNGQTATGATPSVTYAAAGTYPVNLTVTDADGDTATATATVTVTPGATTTTTSSTTTTTQPTTTTTSTTTTTTPTTTTTTTPTTTTTASTTTTTTPTTTTTTTPTTTTTTSTTTTTTPTTTTTSTTTPTTTTTTTTPTTTTTSTTTPTTTTTTTPTTTTTTTPPASDDSVSVKFSGALSYTNSGTGTGDLVVDRDGLGITRVEGSLNVPGTNGGTAKVTVDVNRAWILPFWVGTVAVSDPGAGVSLTTPVIGGLSTGTTADSATTTSSWFQIGTFPNLIKPYSLKWSVIDAG